MIVLGIDTATPQVGCALGDGDGPLASFHASRGRRHAETLVPAVAFVCEQAGVALDQIDIVAVDIGPGLFTGLRVGLATAKTMAGALGVPMVGLTSLDVLAEPLRHCGRLVAAMVDARRGEVFWALYRPSPDGMQRLTEYAVDEPVEVAAVLAGKDCLAVGDGAQRYAEHFTAAGATIDDSSRVYPSAAVLVELAERTRAMVTPEELQPLYLRTADVRINWQQRSPVVAGEAR